MQQRLRLQFVAPDDQVSVGRDDGLCLCLALGNLVFLRIGLVVTQEHAFHIDRLAGGVIEFHPVVALEVVVDIDTVGSAYLVDAYRGDALFGLRFLGKRRETGYERLLVVFFLKVDNRIWRYNLIGGRADGGQKLGIPELVA